METHVTILAVLAIAFGLIGLGAAAFLFIAIAGGGLISADATAIAITSVVAIVIAGFLTLLALPSIIAGVGLLRHSNWARILTLILAALNLPNIPFGTALGVYAFWVLLNDQTTPLFTAPKVEPLPPVPAV